MQVAFDNIMTMLAADTMIKFPDFTKSFFIDTDASIQQLGSIIYQVHSVIKYFFKETERVAKKLLNSGERTPLHRRDFINKLHHVT